MYADRLFSFGKDGSFMKKSVALLCALLTLLTVCAGAGADNTALPAAKFRDAAVHDPSVIFADGAYYIFGSHMAAARSEDLIAWKMISRNALEGCRLVENAQTEMKEALSWAKTYTFWAPDVQRLNDGRYYMYYCCCEGSSPLSALGVAVSDAPEGPYRNLGIILKSGMPGYDATQLPNAVDPCTFFDKEGRLWMVYGSYSGGIFILEMDPDTGFPLEGQGYGKKLLGKNHSRIEGPYILYSPDTDYYYLFLSFGGLEADDGYNIRVCRSKNPDGPYTDAPGHDMIECGGRDGTYFNDPDYEDYGVKLLGSYRFEPLAGEKAVTYRSPGHNSAIYDEKTGRYFLLFHTRFADRKTIFYVRVHQFMMNADGWPVVLPLRYAGEEPEAVPPETVAGTYRVLFHERDINGTEHVSQLLTLKPDGTAEGCRSGTWNCVNGRDIRLLLDGTAYCGVVNICYEAERACSPLCFTALDETGAALWGVGE